MKKILLLICQVFLSTLLFAQTLNETQGTGSGVNITSGDFNTMYGDSTGSNLTSGSQVTFIGYQAGQNNTTSESTFIGYQAGKTNTTGFDNTFIGWQAGSFNLTGGDNTFIGTESGENNTTGYDNTFVGEESGTNTTSGYENTFIGEDAGFGNTTGYRNTFVGNEAGISSNVGYRNTGIGDESLSDVDDGHHNTAVGDSSGIDIGDGIYNTMIGAASGVATEYADYNTFVGAEAGWDNNRTNSTTNANRNTYLGYRTGYSNREGEDNVGIGAYSNFDNTNNSRTTFIGADIDVRENDVIAVGYSADNDGRYSIAVGWNIDVDAANNSIIMGYNTKATSTADNSVGIGSQSYFSGLRSVGIGELDTINADNAIAIGYDAKTSGTNSIAIGYQTSVLADNEVYIGNSSTASIGGVVNWTAASDGRFKTGVTENVPGLNFIDILRPVTYHFNAEKMQAFQGVQSDESMQKGIDEKEKQVYSGFVAQEVYEAAKLLGYNFSGVKVPLNPDKEMYGLRYAEFVVPLVKATQELHQKTKEQEMIISYLVEEQKKQDALHQQELTAYKNAFEKLSQRLEVLEANYQMENRLASSGKIER